MTVNLICNNSLLYMFDFSQGCAVKPKLMGGWQKQKNSGTISAYAYLSVSLI